MKYDTKASYHTALLGVMDIAPIAVVSCFQRAFKFSYFREILPKSVLVIKVSPLDFEYCVILIYRLKVSDRAGDRQVAFIFHIRCVAVCVFSLLKKHR